MGKYFSVEVIPTIAASTQVAYSADDVLFDWTSFQVPRGANKLISVTVIQRGTEGATQAAKDIDLVFAKTINGSAPATMGTANATASAAPAVSNHIIGLTHLDAAGDFGAAAFDYFSVGSTGSGAAASMIPALVLEGEVNRSGDNVGYDTLYVGGIAGNSAGDFGTGVVTSRTVDVSGLSAAQLVNADIEGTNPTLQFAVGDIIHATDDIILGEIESLDANTITFKADGSTTTSLKGEYTVPADLAAWKIQNGAGAAGDLASGDELFNIHPVRIILSFEK
tara:strand:+ start:41 stop:880 length:840 start_codon:yes stop_codon:yes gene_type:complete